MATISLTIPTNQVTRVVDAMCAAGGYGGDPSDMTARNAFAKQMLIDYIKRIVIGTETAQAQQAAIDSVAIPTDPGLS